MVKGLAQLLSAETCIVPVVLHAGILHVLWGAAYLAEVVAFARDVAPSDVHIHTGLEGNTGLQQTNGQVEQYHSNRLKQMFKAKQVSVSK